MSRFDQVNYGQGQPDPDQEKLKPIFRAAELERRQARRKMMLNAAALDNEPLTPEEVKTDEAIKDSLTRMSLEWEKQTTPGYWRRLWAALRGK